MSYYPTKRVLFTTIAEITDILECTFGDHVIVSIPVPIDQRADYIKDPEQQRKSCVFLCTAEQHCMLELTDGLVFVPDTSKPIGYMFSNGSDDHGEGWSEIDVNDIDQANIYVGQRFPIDMSQFVSAQEIGAVTDMVNNGLKIRMEQLALVNTDALGLLS